MADLAALAEEVEEGVRGSVRDLKRELRQAKHEAQGSRADDWRHRREAWRAGLMPDASTMHTPAAGAAADNGVGGGVGGSAAGGGSDVEGKLADLAAEVRRLVALGRASAEDLRVASTVLDSVRDQLRHILRG